MKTKSKLSAYILRDSTGMLLFSCVLVVLCSAINLPEKPRKTRPPQDNAAFGANEHDATLSVPASATRKSRSLSFADRVAYQRAIEDVYWRYRIWPKERHDPKPLLDAVMSQAQFEKKVEDYLRNSQTLEDYWQGPITADQLQTEIERMASHTKQPEVLRELFEALGNDPFVIAECLARPVLTERLAAGTTVLAGVSPASTKLFAANTAASTENRFRATNRGVTSYTLPVIGGPSGGCTDDTWTATTLINAPTPRVLHTAVWTGTEMIVWGGTDNNSQSFNTGGRYNPSTDSWTATSTTNAPEARHSHSAVWTGSEMIVWGGGGTPSGIFNTGGKYNPGSDSWTATSTTNAPAARYSHTAVWTGSEMIVWGGAEALNDFNTGARYDAATDSWTATSSNNAPDGRLFHTAVWTGSEMIIWGGVHLEGGFFSNLFDTGGRYSANTNSWTATSTTNVPAARYLHTAVWTGSEMIVWGGAGSSRFNTGGRYDPGTESWAATSTTNVPAARHYHTAVWTGSEMIVWGGINDVIFQVNTGGRYDSGTDSWTATSTTNAPDARGVHTAVWTGTEMIVWGGFNDVDLPVNTGGRYCAAASSPTPTATPRIAPTPRARPTPVPRP
jgi:N-acetylneuraminic acid mutarotase